MGAMFFSECGLFVWLVFLETVNGFAEISDKDGDRKAWSGWE